MDSEGHGSVKFDLINPEGSNAGEVMIENVLIKSRPNFIDYLRSGWCINTSFAIDFTASNGDIEDANSLHHQDSTGRVQNQYEQAIMGVGSIIQPYGYEDQYAVFGFGGVPRHLGADKISHCFNLSGSQDPKIRGLANVYSAYKTSILNTKLAGPTYFQYILKALLSYV